jgi:hypothetical protein
MFRGKDRLGKVLVVDRIRRKLRLDRYACPLSIGDPVFSAGYV